MPARLSGPARSRRPTSRREAGGRAADDGFTLVEVLVSIAVIGIVTSALLTFFVTTVSATSRQSHHQAAVQLATDAAERVRAIKGSAVLGGRDQTSTDSQWNAAITTDAAVEPYLVDMARAYDAAASYPAGATAPLPTTARSVTLDGLLYGQHWYVGRCWQPPAGGDCGPTQTTGYVPFFRVVVAVTWRERNCPSATCSYLTSTLVSSASGDPVFNSNQTAQPPTVDNPGGQTGEVSVPDTLQLTASGGAPPLTWTGTGLPPGLTMNSSGLISGTPTTAGTYPVSVSVTDGFALVGTAAFSWTVVPLPALTSPAAQTTTVGAAVSLPIVATGGTAPLVWSVTTPGPWGGTGLPPGLSINTSTGTITGAPTAAGSAKAVTVTVTDALGKFSSGTFTWTVAAPPAPLAALPTRIENDQVMVQV